MDSDGLQRWQSAALCALHIARTEILKAHRDNTVTFEPIKSYPIADGGQAIYNSTIGIAVFKDSTGKVIGFGDAQAITNNLPR